PDARTAFLFTRVGLSGADMGACAILPRIIGHGRAAELLFTGRSMSAEEGVAWGFFSRICDTVQADAKALAESLANGPSRAHSVTKRQLDAEWAEPIDIAIDMEAEAQAELMTGNDFKRAFDAFAGKRRPEFRGD
nr:enoyl-CoA hydratase [Sphingomonas sp.]